MNPIKSFLLELKLKMKFTHLLIIGYVLLMSFAYFYINSVLKDGSIKVTTKQKDSVDEVKKVDVKLLLKTTSGTREYKSKLENIDTVRDFLDSLQNAGGFTYERTFYADKTVINEVNGLTPYNNYTWKLTLDDKDLTSTIDKTTLKDNAIYMLSLVP